MKYCWFFVFWFINACGPAGDFGIEMVFVKGGTFQMGSNEGDVTRETPVHTVSVSDFHIGKHEITQKQWREVMGTSPSGFKDCDECPVEKVSWHDAKNFLSKLNQKTGKRYRLPYEAEWEYAARSGGKDEKWAGTNSDVGRYAWYQDNSGSKTHPVGTKMPNGLGIYDMSGNVWEWCEDWYDANYYAESPTINPQGPSTGQYRVLRGGSWFTAAPANRCRAAFRGRNNPVKPDHTHPIYGFRVCLPVK